MVEEQTPFYRIQQVLFDGGIFTATLASCETKHGLIENTGFKHDQWLVCNRQMKIREM